MEYLHIAAVFFIALLSGLGIGGGGLFAVYLSLVGGLPQLAVQGFNLLFFLFSSSASVLLQLWRQSVMLRAVAVLVAAGVVGAMLGVLAAHALPEELLRRAFGAMLVTGGIISLRASMREGAQK